jgi:LysM repeat protein
MCIAGVRSSVPMEPPITNGKAMRRRFDQVIGVTIFSGLALFSAGCGSVPLEKTETPELLVQPAPLVRDRGLELATLRSELAAVRIAAAKKEAELLELRDLVRQLRLENAESRQAFLDLRDQAEQRQRDASTVQDMPPRQAEAQTTQDIRVLKDTVATLAQELGQLRQDLAKPVTQELVSQPMAMSVTTIVPAHLPSRITVQPGDTLGRLAKRHRTTVDALRKRNGLTGDVLAIGRTLMLPTLP